MKKPIRNILFTFDYELFLGARSGTPEKCILQPTNTLLQLFSKHKIKNAVFFVDTTYLLRLTHPIAIGSSNDIFKTQFEQIKTQIQKIISEGHYVFPHIHPHWLDAVLHNEKGQWSLTDYSKYRFHNINKQLQEELFDRSVKLLYDIILPVNSDYKINAYRAGGWSIQPFRDFKPLFDKHNIEHEFSVLPEFKNLSDAQYFDFSNVKSELNTYRFSEEVNIIDEKGKYKEYVISTISLNKKQALLNKLWLKYLWKTGNRSCGDGSSVSIKDEIVRDSKEDNKTEMVSVELLNTVKMPVYKKYISEHNYMHFISHPKMLSQHNLKCFDDLLSHLNERYELNTDFLKV